MLANCAKVPLAVKGLRPLVVFPDTEPNSFVPGLFRLVHARAHQCLSHATSEPFTRRVQPHQFDGFRAFDARSRFSGTKLGVTCCDPVDFRNQERGGRIGQLSRLLSEVKGCGDVGGQVFRSVVGRERLGESSRTQFSKQTRVFAVGTTNRHVWVLSHTLVYLICSTAPKRHMWHAFGNKHGGQTLKQERAVWQSTQKKQSSHAPF